MKLPFLTLFLTLNALVFAQQLEVKFGSISNEEKTMTAYAKDKDAKAVVLFDKGKSMFIDFEGGYKIRFERHRRVKIFDKRGTDQANIEIPYYIDGYGKTEIVKEIKAVTYNWKDGQLQQKSVKAAEIYKDRKSNRWASKKFTFPDVQDGSILEYGYVLETPFHFNLPDWTFQDKIPTIYSEYEVGMIPFYEYVYLVQGANKWDYQDSRLSKLDRSWGNQAESYGQSIGNGVKFNDYIYTYVLKDIPAFKDESYISSINDYIVKMDFQLATFYRADGSSTEILSTWPGLCEALLKHERFGKYLKASSRIAKKLLASEIKLKGADETAKAEEIVQYVKRNFTWNSHAAKYTVQSAKSFVSKKQGNSAEINLFLIALLKEAGIDAKPVILSTRSHGKISSDYPFDHFTNYVVALVNGSKSFLTDATTSIIPYNMLPERCLNEQGLVVEDTEKSKWVYLTNNELSTQKNMLILVLDSSTLDMKTRVSIQTTGYIASRHRTQFRDDSTAIKQYFAESIGKVNTIVTQSYGKPKRPYGLNFLGTFETEKFDGNIVVKPFLGLPMSINELKQRKRSYPVDLVHAFDEQFESTLQIPGGYTITDLPEDYNVDNGLVAFNLTYRLTDGQLKTIGNYQFKKANYPANEYGKIKYYLDQVVERFNLPVVVEKVK